MKQHAFVAPAFALASVALLSCTTNMDSDTPLYRLALRWVVRPSLAS